MADFKYDPIKDFWCPALVLQCGSKVLVAPIPGVNSTTTSELEFEANDSVSRLAPAGKHTAVNGWESWQGRSAKALYAQLDDSKIAIDSVCQMIEDHGMPATHIAMLCSTNHPVLSVLFNRFWDRIDMTMRQGDGLALRLCPKFFRRNSNALLFHAIWRSNHEFVFGRYDEFAPSLAFLDACLRTGMSVSQVLITRASRNASVLGLLLDRGESLLAPDRTRRLDVPARTALNAVLDERASVFLLLELELPALCPDLPRVLVQLIGSYLPAFADVKLREREAASAWSLSVPSTTLANVQPSADPDASKQQQSASATEGGAFSFGAQSPFEGAAAAHSAIAASAPSESDQSPSFTFDSTSFSFGSSSDAGGSFVFSADPSEPTG